MRAAAHAGGAKGRHFRLFCETYVSEFWATLVGTKAVPTIFSAWYKTNGFAPV